VGCLRLSECVGIIVDGDGDFASLRNRFSNGFRVVKTDGPRGHTAPPADIATRSRKQIAILRGFRCARIVVMVDFEERREPYQDFLDKLLTAFAAIDFGLPVRTAVPNRMIENWYLADIKYLSAHKAFLRKGLRQKRYEGTNGKAEIKKCMEHGHSYSETKHGPEMFAILRFDAARKNSPSFNALLALVQPGKAKA